MKGMKKKKFEEYIPPVWYLKDVRDFISYIRDFFNKSDRMSIDGFISLQREARKDLRLYDFIRYYYSQYDSKLLRAFDFTFPIVIYPAPKKQRYDIESVIGGGLELMPSENPDILIDQAGQNFLNLLLEGEKRPWDDPTYRLVKLEIGEEIKANCAIGKYFNALTTCDVLDFELLINFDEQTKSTLDFGELQKKLKLRNHLHTIEDSILEPRGRSAAMSISTVIIFRVADNFNVLINERSKYVARHPDLAHVIPSFMFQPVMRFYKEEYSIRHNIYREYLEEVFAKDNLIRPERQFSHDFFYNDPNLRYLEKLVGEGKAKFYFTGVSINLGNLGPEICTLLLIEDPQWFINHKEGRKVDGLQLDVIKANWEFKAIYEHDGYLPEGKIGLDLGKQLNLPEAFFRPDRFVPYGAAALYLATMVGKEEMAL